MCLKWETIYSSLCIKHNVFKLGKDLKDIFTGYYKIENHNNKLQYFCRDNNQLCCTFYIC